MIKGACRTAIIAGVVGTLRMARFEWSKYEKIFIFYIYFDLKYYNY